MSISSMFLKRCSFICFSCLLRCWLLNDLLGVMNHVIARQITLTLLGQTFSISFDGRVFFLQNFLRPYESHIPKIHCPTGKNKMDE